MIRLEFVKGQGGVVNIINGNLMSVVREDIINIEDIDRVIVNTYEAIAINDALFAIEISGYVIIFDSTESMQPYFNQINLFDGEVMNPGINGIQKPVWDVASRNKIEGIQIHTYIDTDIEKDLIKE